MRQSNDPTLLSLSEAADLIAERKISSRELTQACLARILGKGNALNAFIHLDPDFALRQADAADERLARQGPASGIHGVPLAHKDMYYRPGRPSTGSSTIRRDFVPDYLATTLARLDQAGAIELGTLMLQEFCLGASGTDLFYGQCRNPWSEAHVPGGSSGGSGSAVAGRLVFGSLGSDTNGSIRIPSSANGVVGLRPTRGRVSRYGAMPLSASMDTMGPLARSARDIARILAAIAGPDPFDPSSATVTVENYEARLDRPLAGRKLGLFLHAERDGVDPQVAARIEHAVEAFQNLGCEIRLVDFSTRADCDNLGNILVKVEGAGIHRNWLVRRSAEYARQARGRLEAGLLMPAWAYWQAQTLRKHLLRQFMEETMSDLDAVIMPVIPEVLTTIAEYEEGDVEQALRVTAMMTKFNRPTAYLGVPSLCIPIGLAGGVPTSLQLVGRPFHEATVLNLGHVFLQETGFDRMLPPSVA